MTEFIAGYTTLTAAVVAGFQRLGLLSIPVVLVIAAIVNYFGGEKAIRAVGVAIAVVMVLSLVLVNATALGNWIGAPTIPAGGPAAVPKPGG